MKKLITLILIVSMLSPLIAFAAEEYAICPQYRTAYDFSGDYAVVIDINGNRGVIDKNGSQIFGFDGTKFALRKNNLLMVLGENNMAAFFDISGNRLTEYIYDTYTTTEPKTLHAVNHHYLTSRFDGDGTSELIPVSRNGKFGFINAHAAEVIPPAFEYAEGFYKGIARISSGGRLSQYGTYTNGKYGYINEKGEILYPADALWMAAEFTENYAAIADGQWKTIDKSMNIVNLNIGNYVFESCNEYFIKCYHPDNLYICMFFDYNGKLIAQGGGDSFIFGTCIILDGKKLVDSSGNVIYEADENIRILQPFTKDSSLTQIRSDGVNYSKNLFGAIDQNGKEIFPCVYSMLTELEDNLFYTEDNDNNYCIYTNHAQLIKKLNCRVSYYSSSGMIAVSDPKTQLYGYIKLPPLPFITRISHTLRSLRSIFY